MVSEDTPLSAPRRTPWRVHLLAPLCIALLLIYAALSWTAHLTKSPTYDEPYHALAGYTHLWLHDFRLDAADPPLWQYFAAIATQPGSVAIDSHAPNWVQQPAKQWLQWIFCVTTLYRTPGNNPAAFIGRQQVMMMIVAVALGALICRWAWRCGGPVAAVIATALFAFDPGFLGYGPLVKNDVAFSLEFVALSYALWRLGERASLRWMLAVALASAAMVLTKYSGVIAGVIVPIVLLIQIGLGIPKPVSEVRRRPGFFGRAGGIRAFGVPQTPAWGVRTFLTTIGLCVFIGYIAIWAAYGFRFSPTPDPTVRIDTSLFVAMSRVNGFAAAHEGRPPNEQELAGAPTPGTVRTLQWVEAHRLLPQAFTAGLLFTYQSALVRPTYLLGQRSMTGWWYYFPFALLVKTPLSTVAAEAAAGVLGVMLLRRAGSQTRSAAVCIVTPIVIYMMSAMHSNLNIGIRHVLPIVPLLMIGTGCVAAACVRRWRRTSIVVLSALGIGLVAESASAHPDYIAFFNAAAGGSRGGIHLLGDSNLDWGQDLPSLVRWQHEHPDRPLYLAYFGLADPAWYGLKYTPLPGGYAYDPKPAWPSGTCTVAVSATYLQGILVDPQLYEQFYARLLQRKPTAVLGGTIYLFDLDVR